MGHNVLEGPDAVVRVIGSLNFPVDPFNDLVVGHNFVCSFSFYVNKELCNIWIIDTMTFFMVYDLLDDIGSEEFSMFISFHSVGPITDFICMQ